MIKYYIEYHKTNTNEGYWVKPNTCIMKTYSETSDAYSYYFPDESWFPNGTLEDARRNEAIVTEVTQEEAMKLLLIGKLRR